MGLNDGHEKSDLYSTVGRAGRNYTLAVTNLADFEIEHPVISAQLPGRTTIEIYNEGPSEVRVWFKGSAFADGRKLKVDGSITYSISDMGILYARGLTGAASLKVAEIS